MWLCLGVILIESGHFLSRFLKSIWAFHIRVQLNVVVLLHELEFFFLIGEKIGLPSSHFVVLLFDVNWRGYITF
jgi:hypothetical protein